MTALLTAMWLVCATATPAYRCHNPFRLPRASLLAKVGASAARSHSRRTLVAVHVHWALLCVKREVFELWDA